MLDRIRPDLQRFRTAAARGVRTFQVDCHGLLSAQTCMKAARKICGEEPVRAVDSARALRQIRSRDARVPVRRGAGSVGRRAAAAVVEQVNLSGDALFATDHATLAPTARESLDRLLSERADHTYSQVSVTGFTDSVGSDDYNLALSKRRAESVAAYLKAHGLKTDSLTVTGRGKADPVASNTTPEGRASNRRVEIRLQH